MTRRPVRIQPAQPAVPIYPSHVVPGRDPRFKLDIAHVVNDAARCARLTSADEAASHLRHVLEDVLTLVDLETFKESLAGYDELTVETIQRAIKLVGSVRCLLCPGREFDPNEHSHRANN